MCRQYYGVRNEIAHIYSLFIIMLCVYEIKWNKPKVNSQFTGSKFTRKYFILKISDEYVKY